MILGRRTFDLGVAHWDGTPFPVPSFVLSHRPPPADLAGGFVFVDSGIDAALRQAREAAGGRDVRLMGAHIAPQYLSAGHVDEIGVQLVPTLLGGGERLFPKGLAVRLQPTACIATPQVTHLRYTVLRE